MKLGVGLVAYKMSAEYIQGLSNSLQEITLQYKIVVDNSPTKESEFLFTKFGWQYIHRPDNPGFGFSHNLIFKNYGDKADYHLVLNPDLSFNSNIIMELIDFMIDTKDCGAVSPAIFYPNGEFQELRKLLPSPYGWYLRRFAKKSTRLKKYNKTFELQMAPKDGIFKYPYMSGCFMLLRSSVIRKIGLFDDKIFMYGEDTDLSRRLWENNTFPYYYGKVSATHVFAKGSHKSLKLLLVAIRSTIYYFCKWGWLDTNRKKINSKCLNQFKI
jgi:GT2 family glycosyltransferase